MSNHTLGLFTGMARNLKELVRELHGLQRDVRDIRRELLAANTVLGARLLKASARIESIERDIGQLEQRPRLVARQDQLRRKSPGWEARHLKEKEPRHPKCAASQGFKRETWARATESEGSGSDVEFITEDEMGRQKATTTTRPLETAMSGSTSSKKRKV